MDEKIKVSRSPNNPIVSISISMVDGSRLQKAELTLEKTQELIEFLQKAVNSEIGYTKILDC